MAALRRSRPKLGVPLPADWVAPPMPSLRGLLSAVATRMFDDLGVSVSLWLRDVWWQSIHLVVPSLSSIEAQVGADTPRGAYNARCLARAVQGRRPVLGEHAGFFDLFVPVVGGVAVHGVLVAGPFARERASSAEILHRWLEMTGSHGRLSDPSFSRYLALTLSALTLDDPLLGSFERLMDSFADLVAGNGDPEALGAQTQQRRQELAPARLPERMWATTRGAVDEQAMDSAGFVDHGTLAALGVEAVPQGVVVGLLTGPHGELDPIEHRVRTDAFLRACVSFARERGGTLVGPVGHHGVVLLGDGSRARSALVDLAHQAARTATRFGFALHCGIADKKGSEPLPARYFAALWAAERALAEGRSVVGGEPQPRPTTARLRRLRTELAACVRQQPGLTSLRFEEYIQAVLAHSGYRYESVRPHLEAGFERLAESIGEGGLLDEKSASELWTSVERTVDASRTVEALIDAYRRVVIDLERALKSPTQARHDRSLRRALSFVREHLGEALPLARAARVAGFAPRHFSALFRKIEHTPYSAYLRDQRVARAKEMLRMTRLTVDRVGRSCGFRTRTHFHRAFRRAVGMTPIAYRES